MIGSDKTTVWTRSCPPNPKYNSTQVFDHELTPYVENLNTIEEFFNFFIDDLIVTMIVQSTNKRLDSQTEPVDEVEIRGFIGLLLLLGVTKKHDIEANENFNYRSVHHMDGATVCMSRDRFKLISSKIAFDDVDTRSARFVLNTKLHKINQMFDHFNRNLQNGKTLQTLKPQTHI